MRADLLLKERVDWERVEVAPAFLRRVVGMLPMDVEADNATVVSGVIVKDCLSANVVGLRSLEAGMKAQIDIMQPGPTSGVARSRDDEESA